MTARLSGSDSSNDSVSCDDSSSSRGQSSLSAPRVRVQRHRVESADSNEDCNCGADQQRFKGQGKSGYHLTNRIVVFGWY